MVSAILHDTQSAWTAGANGESIRALRDECRNLVEAEQWLSAQVPNVLWLAELPLDEDDFAWLCEETGPLIATRSVPPLVRATLFALCARYCDACEGGFWHGFRSAVSGLDDTFDNACRQHFYRARDRLEREHRHLVFPRHPFQCVTAVYHHAVIPKRCEAEAGRSTPAGGRGRLAEHVFPVPTPISHRLTSWH